MSPQKQETYYLLTLVLILVILVSIFVYILLHPLPTKDWEL